MTSKTAKAKGRRLQQQAAEILAEAMGLTIDAEPPAKPGERRGVVYVPEGQGDLRIRRMGQPGADIVLASQKAQWRIAIDGRPAWIECKNQEAFRLDAATWSRGSIWLQGVYEDTVTRADKVGAAPLLILSRNHFPILAAIERGTRLIDTMLKEWRSETIMMVGRSLVLVRLFYFTDLLRHVEIERLHSKDLTSGAGALNIGAK